MAGHVGLAQIEREIYGRIEVAEFRDECAAAEIGERIGVGWGGGAEKQVHLRGILKIRARAKTRYVAGWTLGGLV